MEKKKIFCVSLDFAASHFSLHVKDNFFGRRRPPPSGKCSHFCCSGRSEDNGSHFALLSGGLSDGLPPLCNTHSPEAAGTLPDTQHPESEHSRGLGLLCGPE